MAALSNGDAAGSGHKFAEIVLDTTLAELLAEEPEYNAKESICNIKPCADPRHKTVPRNKKYLIASRNIKDSNDLAHLQLENVSYLLSFWSGAMPVLLMACEGWSDDDTLTRDVIDQNGRTAFSVINEKQRPTVKTFTNGADFTEHCKDSKEPVRWAFGVDLADGISCFVTPELQYQLNSKRWLAECPLRSANDRIIDPECSCSKHTTKDGLWYFGPDCDVCKEEVKKELARLEDKLQNTKLPFVLKLAQALGSSGTMLVKTEEDRTKTIKQIIDTQKEALPSLTPENAHVYPVSLILSDFLPGQTHALNYYVRRDGSIKFLGACHQLSTRSEGGKQHTALTWDHQEESERHFKDTLNDIGKLLKEKGYFGPCGADIMESKDGTQYVIDLNVRTTTSTILGCLRGHCEKRNFNACAVYECLLLKLSREDLLKEFGKELEEGRLILLGNTRLGKKNVWAYPAVLAGEDQEAVKDLSARILKFEPNISSEAEEAGSG